mmetsp:Transcript_16290/g.36079  ORF Transcript_16290/g.36079 Transcript_16290/m.36079 type:complete len:227 (-) Transcript_16290:691-1371(-)
MATQSNASKSSARQRSCLPSACLCGSRFLSIACCLLVSSFTRLAYCGVKPICILNLAIFACWPACCRSVKAIFCLRRAPAALAPVYCRLWKALALLSRCSSAPCADWARSDCVVRCRSTCAHIMAVRVDRCANASALRAFSITARCRLATRLAYASSCLLRYLSVRCPCSHSASRVSSCNSLCLCALAERCISQVSASSCLIRNLSALRPRLYKNFITSSRFMQYA